MVIITTFFTILICYSVTKALFVGFVAIRILLSIFMENFIAKRNQCDEKMLRLQFLNGCNIDSNTAIDAKTVITTITMGVSE